MFFDLALWMCAQIQKQQEAPPPDPGFVVRELSRGVGTPAAVGSVVTVHFVVTGPERKVLANTHKRGLPFSFEYGSAGQELWTRLCEDLRPRGAREVRLSAENAFGPNGVPPIVPANAPLVVRVELVQVRAAGAQAPAG